MNSECIQSCFCTGSRISFEFRICHEIILVHIYWRELVGTTRVTVDLQMFGQVRQGHDTKTD